MVAFATAVSWQLAGAVAWSRVRTGVHHRGDVLLGSAIGARIGLADTAGSALRRCLRGTGQAGAVPACPPGFAEAVLVTSLRVAGSGDFAAARREMRRRGLVITAEPDVGKAASLRGLLAGSDSVLVIAAGGDGTAGTVADCLAGTKHVLGVVPLGTSNDFASSLGIPVDLRRAVVLLARGKVATIDLGRFVPAGQPLRHFVHAATVGLNARFARIATRGDIRDRQGRFAYLLAAAYAMRRRTAFGCELRYADTTEELTVTQLLASGTAMLLGARRPVPASGSGTRPARTWIPMWNWR